MVSWIYAGTYMHEMYTGICTKCTLKIFKNTLEKFQILKIFQNSKKHILFLLLITFLSLKNAENEI